MATVTRGEIRRAFRGIVSDKFNDRMPLDKQNNQCNEYLVKKYFPKTNEVLVVNRQTPNAEPIVASVLLPILGPDIVISFEPEDKELHTDPLTGKPAMSIDGVVVGVVVHIDGDPDGMGSVFLGYVDKPDDVYAGRIPGCYAVKYGETHLKINNDGITLINDLNVTDSVIVPKRGSGELTVAGLTSAFGSPVGKDGYVGIYTVTPGDADYIVTVRDGVFRVAVTSKVIV